MLGVVRTTTDCRRERLIGCKVHSCNISNIFRKHIQWPKGIASQPSIPSTSGRPFTSHAGQTTSPRISRKVSKMQQNDVPASSYIFFYSIAFHFNCIRLLTNLENNCPVILSKHFSVKLLQCNIIAVLGVLIVGGATKIGNRMEIIPIIISMYIFKMMAITYNDSNNNWNSNYSLAPSLVYK